MDQTVQSENTPSRRKGKMKAVKVPFVAWGVSLAIHLLLLFFVSHIFWSGKRGLGIEGKEYEVGIAVGAGTDTITTDAGEMAAQAVQDAQAVDEMAFESDVTADVELQHFNSEFSAESPSTQTPSLESLTTGQSTIGQGLWADVRLAGGGKGQGGASFFGLEAKGGKFVYVVDRSGSMGGQPLIAAKAELTRSIMNMGDGIEFFVFFYNTDSLGMPGGELVKAGKSNVSDALAWIEGVTVGGGTDPLSTMKHALSMKPDAIWLLSDGQFSLDSAEKISRENPGRRVTIHTIAFFSRAGEAVLRKIAAENGGKYRFVQKP